MMPRMKSRTQRLLVERRVSRAEDLESCGVGRCCQPTVESDCCVQNQNKRWACRTILASGDPLHVHHKLQVTRCTLSVVRVEPGGRLVFLLVFRCPPCAKDSPSRSTVLRPLRASAAAASPAAAQCKKGVLDGGTTQMTGTCAQHRHSPAGVTDALMALRTQLCSKSGQLPVAIRCCLQNSHVPSAPRSLRASSRIWRSRADCRSRAVVRSAFRASRMAAVSSRPAISVCTR